MKTGGILLLVGSIVFSVIWIFVAVGVNAEWQTKIGANWTLADKSSTIAEKSDYINKFVVALEGAKLEGTNDALFFPTPNNSFDLNLKALKTLQARLETIKTMKQDSFEYQTAIQQITAQEQGEAQEMLSVLQGSWYKVNHYLLWNSLIFLFGIIFICIMFFAGLIMLMDY